MSRPFVVVGDKLSHGGSVVTGSGQTDIGGKPVARIGDKAVCVAHGPTTIVSGDATVWSTATRWRVMGTAPRAARP